MHPQRRRRDRVREGCKGAHPGRSWDLDKAIRSATDDESWSLKGGFEPLGGASAPAALGDKDDATTTMPFATVKMDVLAKLKALTEQDILYAFPPPFNGHGFELKDISD